jgi:hypothetical protein
MSIVSYTLTFMMEISSYNLSWQGFTNCFTTAFKNLKEDGNFSDITLVCDQNKQLKVHKIIIGACSSFFRNILVGLPAGHLYFYVDGVTFEDLKAAINFMYIGHTEVEKDNLDNFIKVCKKLEIEGLSEPNIATNAEEKVSPGKKITKEEKETACEVDINDMFEKDLDDTEIFENKVKVEVEDEATVPDFKYKKAVIDGERKFICTTCDYTSTYKAHLKNHFQSKHLHIKYPCDQCNYSSGHTSDLAKHKRFKHDQHRAHQCEDCDYKAFDRSGLKNHVMRKHGGMNKDNVDLSTTENKEIIKTNEEIKENI